MTSKLYDATLICAYSPGNGPRGNCFQEVQSLVMAVMMKLVMAVVATTRLDAVTLGSVNEV